MRINNYPARLKGLSLALLGMLLLSFCYAITPDFVYKAGQDIDFKLPCFNNGTYCSTAAQCNLTVNNPDGINLLTNKLMTNQLSYHNYTISKSYTWTYGDFYYSQMCCDGGVCGADDGYFQITPSGSNNQVGYYVLIIVMAYGALLFGTWKQDIAITTLSSFALVFIGLYVLFYGIDIYKNYLTNAFAIITIFIGGYIGIMMGLEMMRD